MSKIANDKYYTPKDLAKYCYNKAMEIIGEKNITEIVESSAGNGVFLDFIDKPYLAYDILPEDSRITKADFLELHLDYKKGRLIGFNPPFGGAKLLYKSFYNKAVELGDYIAFILPIQLYNAPERLYKFDLIHSEDLGFYDYSGVKLRCCFNIYERPQNGLNPKPIINLQDISICRYDSKRYLDFEYDIRICYWGNSSAGKVLSQGENYNREYKIKINNKELRDSIISFFYNVNWKEELNSISSLQITQRDLFKTLKKHIPNIR